MPRDVARQVINYLTTKGNTGKPVNNYLLLGLSVLTLVALNQGHMRITNYVPITLLCNKYIYLFIYFLFYLPSLL